MTTTEYAALWGRMQLIETRLGELTDAADIIMRGRARYDDVGNALGIPWWWIGAIHMREASCSFAHHLHNGDSLKARTVHVPSGRPLTGRPPFTWEDSAMDALRLRSLDRVTDWSIGSALSQAEHYNGMGYAGRGLRSPYLWGGTDLQQPGKYVRDGIFDPTATDAQIGVAALFSVLAGLGARID